MHDAQNMKSDHVFVQRNQLRKKERKKEEIFSVMIHPPNHPPMVDELGCSTSMPELTTIENIGFCITEKQIFPVTV